MQIRITKQAAADAVAKYSDGRPQIEAPLLIAASNALSASDPVAATNLVLAGIAGAFGTARQFPRFDQTPNRRKPVSEYSVASEFINVYGRHLTSVAEIIEATNLIAQKLQASKRSCGSFYTKAAGGVGNLPLSAVSKWLWFTCPDVAVIYDDRARDCMRLLGYEMPNGNYGLFCQVFQHLLHQHINELKDSGYELCRLIEEQGFLLSHRAATRKVLDLVLYRNNTPTGRIAPGAPLEDADLFNKSGN